MLLGKDSEVLVHNFAPECFFSVEVAYYVLRILCYIEKFLNSYYKLIVLLFKKDISRYVELNPCRIYCH